MGFIMRLLDGFFVRRHDQAKGCTAWLIKPVGQKLDFIFLLNRQIQLVSMGDGASRRSFDVVAIHIQRHFLRLLSSVTPAGAQCDTAWGGHETPSIFQISPVRVTTYAVFPMNSSEVGRSRPSVMTVNVPSSLTLTSAPVYGTALLGSIFGSTVPCERA